MRGLLFDGTLMFQSDLSKPEAPQGEALIRVMLAGICNTDIEITRGYMGFQGILGHEFVGVVESAPDDPTWEGKRVVGEINANCCVCETCLHGDPTHCPHRTTLGIDRRNGAMADYVTLPLHLLYEVPESVANEQAVFVEPLAAACEITEKLHVRPEQNVVVIGDGKLGLLITQVLQLTGCNLTLVGRHEEKLAIVGRRGVSVTRDSASVPERVDVVVECTGSPGGFTTACQMVRPRGTIVMKSTFHGDVAINLSQLVVNEVTLVGSRCGPFAPALRLLKQGAVDVEALISERYPLDNGLFGFGRAVSPGVLKVLLTVDS